VFLLAGLAGLVAGQVFLVLLVPTHNSALVLPVRLLEPRSMASAS
jgi:hypothetical protein